MCQSSLCHTVTQALKAVGVRVMHFPSRSETRVIVVPAQPGGLGGSEPMAGLERVIEKAQAAQIARTYLGSTCFVSYPFLVEALVRDLVLWHFEPQPCRGH
jgi:hypothetical protein